MEDEPALSGSPRRSLTPTAVDRSDAQLTASVESMLAGLDAWNAHLDRLDSAGRDTALLEHAVSQVPYYQRLPRPTGGWTRLEQLPIVRRAEIATHPDAFVVQSPGQRFTAKTSGTMGTPLTGLFDAAAWYALNQDIYASIFEAIPELHGTARPGAPAVTLVCNELNRPNTSMLLVSLDGAVFRRRVLGRDRASDAAVIDEFRDSGCPLLYGKANYLLDFLRAERARGSSDRARPRAILASGEKLFEDDRVRLEDWFGCRMYDAYASVEGGVIAIGCPSTRALHVLDDRVALGIFNGRDSEPTGDGELVLTNYTNFAMPFIRYRTGDGAVLVDHCACGHLGPAIVEMRGREVAWFDLADRRVRASSLDRALVRPEIEQFELVQHAPGRFRLSWMPAPGVDEPGFAGRGSTPEWECGVIDEPGFAGRGSTPEWECGVIDEASAVALEQTAAAALPGATVEVVRVASLVKAGAKARRYAIAGPSAPDSWPRELGHQVVSWHPPGAIAFCPPGDELVVADAIGTWILDASGRTTPWARPHSASPTAVAVSADGTRIGVAYADGLLRLGRRNGEPFDVASPGARIEAIAFAPTNTSVASAGADGVIRILDPDTGGAIDTLTWHGVPVTGVTYSPDGESMATCDAGGRVAMWDMTSFDELPLLRHGGTAAARVAFSPTSKFLAGGVGESVVVWHLASAKIVRTIGASAGAATGSAAPFAYSGDGSVILTAGAAGTVAVHDAGADRTLAPLTLDGASRDAAIAAIASAPTSARHRVAAVGCLDGTLHIYVNTQPGGEL